jgi:hypothetical protein
MYGFWGKSTHGNKGVNSAGLALKAGQFFYLLFAHQKLKPGTTIT